MNRSSLHSADRGHYGTSASVNRTFTTTCGSQFILKKRTRCNEMNTDALSMIFFKTPRNQWRIVNVLSRDLDCFGGRPPFHSTQSWNARLELDLAETDGTTFYGSEAQRNGGSCSIRRCSRKSTFSGCTCFFQLFGTGRLDALQPAHARPRSFYECTTARRTTACTFQSPLPG